MPGRHLTEDQKAVASGVASLDATTKVPFAQLPTGSGSTQVSTGNHSHADGGSPIINRGGSRYYFAAVSSLSTLLLSANIEYLIPFLVDAPFTVTRLGLEVTTVGSANSVIRLGVRLGDPTTSVPNALELDAGTIDGTSQTFQEITTNLLVPRGVHWLSATGQGSPTTQPTVRAMAGPHSQAISHTAYNSTLRAGMSYSNAQTGALLTNLVVGNLTVATSAPFCVVRA